MKKELKSNIWKYFLIILTNRRNYLPILSIYFLTLPNSTAQQIGLYTGIGFLMGFLFEIPSGYISDTIGHKKSIILAKFFMLFSTLLFVLGKSIFSFALGSSFMALGFAFTSGTAGAFIHNTLVGLKKENEYAIMNGKIRANVSLISAIIILLIPLLSEISLLLPIKVYLIFDIVGILTAVSLYTPVIKYTAEDEEGEKIISQVKRFKGTGFYMTSLFLGILGGFIIGLSPFKEPFVQSLGFPVIFIGSVMAFSRVIWFAIGNNIKKIKKINFPTLLLLEIFLFSGLIILSSQLTNPYVIGAILAILLGYYHGRGSIIEEYYLKNFLRNQRYKALMLSIKHQIGRIFEATIVILIGFVMTKSFSRGFLISGIILFFTLLIIFPFLKKSLNNK